MSDQVEDITDEELQTRLEHFGLQFPKGKLTDAQRQIQKKRLNHAEAKERADKEKAEKVAAKLALGSPPVKRKAGSRRQTVATVETATSSSAPEIEINPSGTHLYNKAKGDQGSPLLKSPTKDVKLDSPSMFAGSPLAIQLTDAALGRPAASVPVTLSVLHATKGWFQLAERRTNNDGTCPGMITKDLFQGGMYRINFNTTDYYMATNSKVHYPQIEVSLHVDEPGERHSVSILLMPCGYTCTAYKCN